MGWVAVAGVKRESGRPRSRRYAVRTLTVCGVALAGVALVGDWTGFGWIPGPAAIGAIGAVLLAFVLSKLPAATDERDIGDHVPLPSRSMGTDGD